MMITLQSWIEENELHLDSAVCDELLATEGRCYRSSDTEYWVCPTLAVRTDAAGTRVVDEELLDDLVEWINQNNASSPVEVIYA